MSVQDEVPKSRITLTYKTEVDGEPAVVDLPFRMMITGDFSFGTSKDRQFELDQRAPRGLNGSNANDVMKDMNVTLDIMVPNKINPGEAESVNAKLSLESLDSFSPEEVAKQIPQVHSLLLLKKLLEEAQSNIANKKKFAVLLNKLYANPQALEKMRNELKQIAPIVPKDEISQQSGEVEQEENNQ